VEIDGLPLRTRLLDIETVGAGGGSIARLDAGGALRVGPESAGADPGPVIYGRGGREVTVSDANAVLGRLDGAHFLGGAMALDLDAGRAALAGLGREMGLSGEAAALGVVDVANANIERALRRVTIARGHDPRDFTLLAFGGAGPLHACAVAERLDIPRVLVPRYPGVLCALGLLVADVILETGRTVLQSVGAETAAALRMQVTEMVARARSDLAREGLAERDMFFDIMLDVRYQGQAHELTIPFAEDICAAFHAAHQQAYGHAMPGRVVEVVNLRVQAVGRTEKPELAPQPLLADDGASALLGHRTAVVGGGEAEMALYDRARLRPGTAFSGPALVLQMDSTLFVPPGWTVQVDAEQHIVLEHAACR